MEQNKTKSKPRKAKKRELLFEKKDIWLDECFAQAAIEFDSNIHGFEREKLSHFCFDTESEEKKNPWMYNHNKEFGRPSDMIDEWTEMNVLKRFMKWWTACKSLYSPLVL